MLPAVVSHPLEVDSELWQSVQQDVQQNECGSIRMCISRRNYQSSVRAVGTVLSAGQNTKFVHNTGRENCQFLWDMNSIFSY